MPTVSRALDTKSLIKQLGLRTTSTRVALINVLRDATKPHTIASLAKKLENIGMDKATIYRNILMLQREGLVRQVDFHREHGYFEWNDTVDHHHVVCVKCEHVQDFVGCDFQRMEHAALSQAKDFSRITEHSFELFGMCKKCDQKTV